jgi:hypothetical protein
MTDHVIEVTSTPDGLVTGPKKNPLEVAAGDTVTWKLLDANGAPLDAQVTFVSFVPRQHWPNQGHSPFVKPVQQNGQNTVAPSAERGMYLYVVSDGAGNVLPWTNPLFTVGSPPIYQVSLACIVKPAGPP